MIKSGTVVDFVLAACAITLVCLVVLDRSETREPAELPAPGWERAGRIGTELANALSPTTIIEFVDLEACAQYHATEGERIRALIANCHG